VALTLEYLAVDDLPVDERNPKGHALEDIDASMTRFGYVDPVVIDERTGKLLSGHGRREALMARKDRGEPPPLNVEVDAEGRWLAPVVRGVRTTSDIEAGALIVGVNELVAAGGWDPDRLAPLLESIRAESSLVGTGFTNEGLDELLAGLAYDRAEAERSAAGDPDDLPAAPALTKPGDIWQLGRHRLVCGDAAGDRDVRAALLGDLTPTVSYQDPPYGMKLETDYKKMHRRNRTKWGESNTFAKVEGDDVDYNAAPLIADFAGCREQFWWGADYYRATIPAGGSWLVWDKRSLENEPVFDNVLGNQFELCWTARAHRRELLRHVWSGLHGVHGEGEEHRRLHPTQKPVALHLSILGAHGRPGDVVVDLYAGSGSTLVACHQLEMTALLAELSPEYCDTICARYQRMSGDKPVRAGEPVDFGTP